MRRGGAFGADGGGWRNRRGSGADRRVKATAIWRGLQSAVAYLRLVAEKNCGLGVDGGPDDRAFLERCEVSLG